MCGSVTLYQGKEKQSCSWADTCSTGGRWGRCVSSALRVRNARPDSRSWRACLAAKDHGAGGEMTGMLLWRDVAFLPVPERAFAVHTLDSVLGPGVNKARLCQAHRVHLPHTNVHIICTCHMKVYTPFAPATRKYTHHLHLPQEITHIICTCHKYTNCTCHTEVYTSLAPATWKCTHHLHLPQESIHIICTCHKKVYTSFAHATRKHTPLAPVTRKCTHPLHLPHENIHIICTCHKKLYTSFAPAASIWFAPAIYKNLPSFAPATKGIYIICTCHKKVDTPFAPATRKYTHHLHLLQGSIHIICTCYKKVYIFCTFHKKACAS